MASLPIPIPIPIPVPMCAAASIPAISNAATGVPLIIAKDTSRRTCHLHTFLALPLRSPRAFGKV